MVVQFNPRLGLFFQYKVQISPPSIKSEMLLKNSEMAHDKSVRITRCWRRTKNSNKYEKAYVLGTGQPLGSNISQPVLFFFSHSSVRMGGQTSYSGFFLIGLLLTQTSPVSTSTILPLIIFLKRCWCLLVKQISTSPDPLVMSAVTGLFSQGLRLFLRVSQQFWSLICGGALQSRNWEQMRRPLRASMVMSAPVEGKSVVGKGGVRRRRKGGRMRWATMSERRLILCTLQVGRLAANPKHWQRPHTHVKHGESLFKNPFY